MARFDERFLDELKSRLRLSDVIGRTVKLRRQGREFVGLSPFTRERTPSFFVNDDKGFFHDFSAGKHGDLISFLQETQRLGFHEAVEVLAAEAGLALPKPDPKEAEREARRRSLTGWLELAVDWFARQLERPAGAAAREALARRGLPRQEWPRFRLGYAPAGRSELKDHLVAKGALPAELVAAGLLVQPDDGGAAFDRFRDRIIVPIADGRGEIVSFGGRALDPAARAKYLNGPETAVFDKGRVLYGLAGARSLLAPKAPNDAPPLVVVEGYFDVIACQRAGLAAVAPMGTALTEAQLRGLWRFHPEPTLLFDGDRAGQAAAGRAIEGALPLIRSNRSLRIAVLDGDRDPDDLMREEGPAALRAALARATPLVEALFERERVAEPLATPEQRAGLKGRLRAAAGSIADRDLAAAYADALMERYDALFARPRALARAGAPAVATRARAGRPTDAWRRFDEPPGPPTAPGKAAAGRLRRALDGVSAVLARQAVASPSVIDDHLEALETGGFGDRALERLARELVRLRLIGDDLDSEAVRRHLATQGFSSLLADIDRAAGLAGAPLISPDVDPAAAKSQWSRVLEAVHRLAVLEASIVAAKQGLAGALGASVAAELNQLKAERDKLRRAVRTGDIWRPHQPAGAPGEPL